MATVESIRNVTREQVAHEQLARAVERFRKLEAEMRGTFHDLNAATAAMRELGVTVDVEMTPAMQAAWVEHRATRRHA
jgi:hypothetical protein